MRETIYRDEAIEAVLSDLKLVGDFDIDRGIKRACIRRASWRIEDVPSADRPQGEWIYTDNPLRLDDEWACSRCGNISFARTNFCDRCGARMKGADNEASD